MRLDESYAARVELLRRFLDRIFDESARGDFQAMIDAVVRDGWTEAMARAGFALHRKTWQPDVLSRALETEIGAFGAHPITVPGRIVHIWPALPGSGLTPILYGALLGSAQWIRPSSRGRNFAEFIVANWPRKLASLKLLEPQEAWNFADIVVVSGSDETVEKVREIAREPVEDSFATPTRITGYGHRVSFAVVVAGEGVALGEVAEKIARDTVLWHQMGCFSPRAVLFCGTKAQMKRFAAALGENIALEEGRLDAGSLSSEELAGRAQARGVAEFTTKIWGDGLGWVQLSEAPFRGARVSAHTLSLHPVATVDELSRSLALPARHLQGVALAAPAGVYPSWADALAGAGATRICAPGELQAPPGDWPHDGRPNVLGWLRATGMR